MKRNLALRGLFISSLYLLLAWWAHPARADVLYWDNNGSGTPGSGNWDLSSSSWSPSSTLTNTPIAFTNGPLAVFTAGAGALASATITVTEPITIGGIDDNGIAGGTVTALTINASGSGVLNLNDGVQCQFLQNSGVNVTINCPIGGTGSIIQNGSGSLYLYGNNTYSGGTTTTGGQITYYNNNNSFGTGPIHWTASQSLLNTASSTVTLPNDIYIVTTGVMNFGQGSTTCNGNVILQLSPQLKNNATGGGVLTIAGAISEEGPQGLTLQCPNSGTIVLSGPNTYSGQTFIGKGAGAGNTIVSISSLNSVNGGIPLLASSSLGCPTTIDNGTINLADLRYASTLIYTGTGETSDRVLNLSSASGSVTLDQSGTGLLKFTSDLTATGVGSKLLTLQGSTSGIGEIDGAIVDNGTQNSTALTVGWAANANVQTIYLGSVDGIVVGAAISGTGIPAGETITAVNTSTKQVTLRVKTGSSGTVAAAAGETITVNGVNNLTSLTKAGTGTWILGGANTYSGNTTVSAGTLVQGSANTIPSGSGKGNFASSAGATFDLNGISCQLNGFGTSAGNIDNVSAGGNVTLTLGNNNAGGTHSGTISNSTGTVTLVKTGTGNITLSGTNNNYSGGTTVTGGGTLSIQGDGSLGPIPLSPTVNITLDNGCLRNNSSTNNLAANRIINITANGGYFDAGWAPNHPVIINGQITGSGIMAIDQDGSPVVLMNPANNWTGATIVGAKGPGYYNNANAVAWLQLGANNVLPNGPGYGDVYVTNAVQRNVFDLAGFSATINGLWGDAFVNNTVGGASTLTVGNNDATSTFSGVISNAVGTVALTKIGAGTLTLSGANKYTGATTVSAGTLEVQGSLASPTVTVASGAILQLDAVTALNSNTKLVLPPGSPVVNLPAGTSQIGLLSLDGGATLVAPGTYGGIGSGAQHEDSRFTGTGLLAVQFTGSHVNQLQGITQSGSGSFNLSFQGTPQARYYLLYQTNVAAPLADWMPVPGSTNVADPSGLITFPVTIPAPAFYRSVAIDPAP